MANSLYNFWGKILRCTTVRVSAATFSIILKTLFGKAEICDFDVALAVKKYVFWLQISVDDSILVETSEGFY